MIAIMLTMTVAMNDALYETTNYANTKAYLVTVDSIMYSDINLAGYNTVVGGRGNPDAVFSTADSRACKFYADINNDGTPELIEYKASNTSPGDTVYTMTRTASNWKSPNPPVIGRRFTTVRFTYYDANGAVTTNRSNVAGMRIQLSTPIPGATSGIDTSTVDFKVNPSNL